MKPLWTFACLLWLPLLLAHGQEKQEKLLVASRFDSDREGWQIYDYNGGSGGRDVFFPVTFEKRGGVKDSGYIWGDDSRWRIDTPEKPHSILALIRYQNWIKGGPLDLRDAEVSVYLRGDKLDLKGAKCYFWAHKLGTRWHLTAKPLKISAGTWGEKLTFVLKNDEKLWHRSWARIDNSLDGVLRAADSYGFAFVGFSEEVTGRFAMDEFTIRSAPRP